MSIKPVSGRWLAAAGITLAVLEVAACSSTGGGAAAGASSSASVNAGSAAASSEPASLQQQYEQVVSRVLPSVVEISTSEGSGSGVVYDGKGEHRHQRACGRDRGHGAGEPGQRR